MKTFSKRAFLIFSLLFVFSFSVFCEEWFVCLGSFKVKQNALNRVEELNRNNISSFIYETESEGQVLYRVLLDESYDDRTSARAARNKLSNNNAIKKLGINGLWICAAEKVEEVVPVEEEVIVEEAPIEEEVPVEEELPVEEEIPPEEEPPVEEEMPAEEEVPVEEELPPEEPPVEEAPIEEKLPPEEPPVEEVPVEEPPVEELPATASIPAYKKCLEQIPLNEAFQIEQLTLVDFDNLIDEEIYESAKDCFAVFKTDVRSSHAACFVLYKDKDEASEKEVRVLITQGNEGQFDFNDAGRTTTIQTRDAELNSRLSERGNELYLCGITKSGDAKMELLAKNFTREELNNFLINSYSGTSMIVYPKLNKNLSFLPEESQPPRNLQMFTLNKLGRDYVESKDYKDWAWGFFGHWSATVFFEQTGNTIAAFFVELEDDYNSKKLHEQYMNSQDEEFQGEDNHKETVHNSDGWYIKKIRQC